MNCFGGRKRGASRKAGQMPPDADPLDALRRDPAVQAADPAARELLLQLLSRDTRTAGNAERRRRRPQPSERPQPAA
jgi:hypothetical protein